MERHSSKPKPLFEKVQKAILIGGFSVLAGMFGLGLAWLGFAVIVLVGFKNSNHGLDPLVGCMPVLIAGGIVGFVIGLMVSLKTARRGPEAIIGFERKYVGRRGRGRIYAGFPILVIVLLTPLFGRITRLVGQKYDVYVFLGIILVVATIYLLLSDLIPRRWAMLLGIIGWLLTVVLALWYGFYVTGVIGHHTVT